MQLHVFEDLALQALANAGRRLLSCTAACHSGLLFLDVSAPLFEELDEHFGRVQLQAGQGKGLLDLRATLVPDDELLADRGLVDLAAAVLKPAQPVLGPGLRLEARVVVPAEEDAIDYHSVFIAHLSAIKFISASAVPALLSAVTEAARPKPRSDHLIISKIYRMSEANAQ